jgi:hypothetical protein
VLGHCSSERTLAPAMADDQGSHAASVEGGPALRSGSALPGHDDELPKESEEEADPCEVSQGGHLNAFPVIAYMETWWFSAGSADGERRLPPWP